MKKNKLNQGFSLTELSIALVIIALVVGSALSLVLTSNFYAKQKQTTNKMNRIEEALAGFLKLNKRLPCPAFGNTDTENSEFGVEQINTGSDPAACNTDANGTLSGGGIIAGVVPVTSLQLPDEFMFDGWGKRITYAVDLNFINSNSTNSTCQTSGNCFVNENNGVITINDASGSARTDSAIYVLISFGNNGHGAWTKNGNNTRINFYPAGSTYTLLDELENSHLDTSGSNTAYDNIFIQKEFIKQEDTSLASREHFDDIVKYSTKQSMISKAGGIIYNLSCLKAKDILDNPNSNACIGANSKINCETFANEIFTRCLQ